MGKINKDSITEMEQLANSITANTKQTLRTMLSETVSNFLREEVLNEEDEDEDEKEEESIEKTSETEEISDDNVETTDTEEADDVDVDTLDDVDTEDDSESDEWSEFDDYKINNEDGSEEYDFTQEEDTEKIAKIFKLMKNDDQVSVVQKGDIINIKDNENDTEYVIELDNDCIGDECEFNVNESLGYTDDYQDEDVFDDLSMESDDAETSNWHKGIPTGTEKPWPGKKEKVFEITLNDETEMDEEPLEETYTRGAVQDRSTTISNAREQQKARNKRHAGQQVTTTTQSPVSEALQNKINAAIQENKQLKETVAKVTKIMKEAVQVNVNLGHIVRLMTENATTKAEKEDIINRFNSAKTLNESKNLYDTISAELKKTHSQVVLEQKESNVEKNVETKKINESKIYEEPNSVRDLMKRMNML